MPTIIVDASVVIKWFKKKGEEKTKEAEKYLQEFLERKIKIAVPALLFYEIVNIASFDTTVTSNHWQNIFEVLCAMPFEVYPPDKFLVKEIYEMAKTAKISAYDASYLTLAKRLETVLVTSDKELILKGKDLVKRL